MVHHREPALPGVERRQQVGRTIQLVRSMRRRQGLGRGATERCRGSVHLRRRHAGRQVSRLWDPYRTHRLPLRGRVSRWQDARPRHRIHPNGNRYEGGFRDNKIHGSGTLITATGHRYEGETRDDRIHGRGTLIAADGSRYEGEWRDNKVNGRGTLTWANGNRYEGAWQDGKPHGWGIYARTDGEVYEGNWSNGCFEGRDGRRAFVKTTAAACGFK